MAGQMQELLIEVSRNLAVVERLLQEVKSEQRGQSSLVGDLRERVAGLEAILENDQEWSGEERRKVDGRLESGDHTFLLLQQRVADAQNDAARAVNISKDALNAIDAHTSGKHGEIAPTKRRHRWLKWAEILAPFIIPAVISGAGWLFYHLRFLAALAAKEGSP